MWVWLVVMSLLATVFVLWPLVRRRQRSIDTEYNRSQANTQLYRNHLAELEASFQQGDLDQGVYEQLKAELGRSLLEDNETKSAQQYGAGAGLPVLLACVLLVPLISLGFYYFHGQYDQLALRDLLLSQNQLAAANSQGISGAEANATRKVTEQLEKLVKKDPENLNNWYLLARNKVNVQDFRGAIAAYQEILSRDAKQPQILAEFGQVVFMASGSEMLPQVKQLADSALALEPNNTLALSLAGITSYERKQYREALGYWQKAVQILGANNPDAEPLVAGINNIKQILGNSTTPGESQQPASSVMGEPAGTESNVAESKAAELKVTVNVAMGDAVPASPNQTVFVYARAWQGPKMPVAIKKISVADLPTTVTLSESMAMMQGMTIATVGDIELVARLSLDGSPTSKPGDWQDSVGPVSQAKFDQTYDLIIDTKVE